MNPLPIDIIGGGLAGLSLGLALRRADIPVTLHEAGDYPRHRVCGEFISGLADSTIRRLGLQSALQGALRHEEVAWSMDETIVRIQRLPSPALGISRHTLDVRLARQFVAAGGDLCTGSRVTDLAPRAGRVFAMGRRRAADARWIGLKVHARGVALTRELEMHLGSEAYVGLSRIESDVVNVCGLFRRRAVQARGHELLLTYLGATGLTGLGSRLARATIDADSFCAVAALGFDRRLCATERLAIGDAGAMIPPFTGNGMAMAFQSAELALDPIAAYSRGESSWSTTCRATNRALRGRFRVRLASAEAVHPFLLTPRRQRWFAALTRARLLPFGPLYAALH